MLNEEEHEVLTIPALGLMVMSVVKTFDIPNLQREVLHIHQQRRNCYISGGQWFTPLFHMFSSPRTSQLGCPTSSLLPSWSSACVQEQVTDLLVRHPDSKHFRKDLQRKSC